MTTIIAPTKKKKLSGNLAKLGFGLLSIVAAGVAGVTLFGATHANEDRQDWVGQAAGGFHKVKKFCADREVFGFQYETPPIVNFYLNQFGAFNDAYTAWEITHDGQRVVYLLEVQFEDFDNETLTRLAELDSRIDDGDLLTGKFQISMGGFVCSIPGPQSTSEQFLSDFSTHTTINPI